MNSQSTHDSDALPFEIATSQADSGAELGERDGVRYSAYEDVRALPREALTSLMQEAWGYSYRSRAVWVLDAEYLEWLTPKGCTGVIVARDASGQLLGC